MPQHQITITGACHNKLTRQRYNFSILLTDISGEYVKGLKKKDIIKMVQSQYPHAGKGSIAIERTVLGHD